MQGYRRQLPLPRRRAAVSSGAPRDALDQQQQQQPRHVLFTHTARLDRSEPHIIAGSCHWLDTQWSCLDCHGAPRDALDQQQQQQPPCARFTHTGQPDRCEALVVAGSCHCLDTRRSCLECHRTGAQRGPLDQQHQQQQLFVLPRLVHCKLAGSCHCLDAGRSCLVHQHSSGAPWHAFRGNLSTDDVLCGSC